MALFRRLFAINCRMFCTNSGFTPRDLSTNVKIKRVVSMLNEYDFRGEQIDCIITKIGKYIIEDKELNDCLIKETIDCWNSNLSVPSLRPNQLDKLHAEDIDFDMSVDLNYVVSKIEPKLLLMTTKAIEDRIDCLKQLSIIGGSRDLWRVFVYSPNGYYLQSWSDFLKKYHYLNYRVLEWLLDKKDKDTLHPHPLIRNSKVMELDFDFIKCRFLFAQRTGLKTVSITNRLSNFEDMKKMDLKALLLSPIDKYLKQIAPNCTEEEFFALEALLDENGVEEDEQIIDDLIQLTTSQNKNKKSSEEKESIESDYQIISRND